MSVEHVTAFMGLISMWVCGVVDCLLKTFNLIAYPHGVFSHSGVMYSKVNCDCRTAFSSFHATPIARFHASFVSFFYLVMLIDAIGLAC